MINDVQKDAKKYSLPGWVFNKLRDDILTGKYEEHEELKEKAIGSQLGVSRTPVREALRQLELEGLVTIIPNKGAYVTGISEKDIQDIFVIRSYLEGLCAKWACEYMTQEQLEQLEEVVYLSEFHAKKEHHQKILELDNKFHQLIYEASHSKILNHVLTDFHYYVKSVRKRTLASSTRVHDSNKEHAAILEAIKEKDCKRAETLATQHLVNTIKNIREKGL